MRHQSWRVLAFLPVLYGAACTRQSHEPGGSRAISEAFKRQSFVEVTCAACAQRW